MPLDPPEESVQLREVVIRQAMVPSRGQSGLILSPEQDQFLVSRLASLDLVLKVD